VVQPWVKEIPPSVYLPSSSPEIAPWGGLECDDGAETGGTTDFGVLVALDGELDSIGGFGFHFEFRACKNPRG